MKNNKGQALVEFIIILPIFILLIMSIIDFSNIIYKKITLENNIDIVSDLYKDSKYDEINKYVSDKNIDISYKNNDDMIVISLSKDINIISPIVSIIIGEYYKVNVEKSIYNE